MIEMLGENGALVAIGFLSGIVLGVAARWGRFCTLGALEDWHYGGSSVRFRMWGVALGAAIISVFALALAGWLDLGGTLYLSQSPGVVAAGLGGLLFGVGMALAGNCGFGALARLGGGELRSLVIVMVMGVAALATASGPLAELRVALVPPMPATPGEVGMAHLLSATFGIGAEALGIGIGVAILGLGFLGHWDRDLLWGVPVGLAIAAGYAGTSHVATHGFEPVTVMSHTFSLPLGETLLFLMLSSGLAAGFGVGSVAGVIVGAFAGSKLRGAFRWQACDDHRELRRQIGGAVMMGIGAVMALGCSVGQGLSAFAVLSYTAPITLAATWLGAFLGLRYLIEGQLIGRSI